MNVPRAIDRDERERVCGQPCFMDHFCRHEVEPAGADLALFAVACERGRADDHCVGLIGRMPVLAHVDRFRRPNEQTGRMRRWIDMENADLRRICSESGRILSHLRSDRFLNSGVFAVVAPVISLAFAGLFSPKLVNATTTIARDNFIFIDYESNRIYAITRTLKSIQFHWTY